MPKTIFNPVLFWDAGDIDLERHADYVIARILDYGDERDLKALRRIYPDEKIIHVVKTRKGLSPRTRCFWSLYFKIRPEEITCLRR
jgi:hypothetical protein